MQFAQKKYLAWSKEKTIAAIGSTRFLCLLLPLPLPFPDETTLLSFPIPGPLFGRALITLQQP
jgi:hypothetical protein